MNPPFHSSPEVLDGVKIRRFYIVDPFYIIERLNTETRCAKEALIEWFIKEIRLEKVNTRATVLCSKY